MQWNRWMILALCALLPLVACPGDDDDSAADDDSSPTDNDDSVLD